MIDYTDKDFREFEELVEMLSSRSQMARIHARLAMPKFVEKHGKEKCDAMFAELTKNDPK